MTTIRRLGPHHFAHLRAAAEGIDIRESAFRYLCIEHGHQSVTAHREVVDQVRAISRRRGDKAWRLIGLTIKVGTTGDRPTLEQFIEERGLDGWSESEVAEMYAEAFPVDPKAVKRQRLRERQLQLIKQLEGAVAETPKASDMVDGWFEESIAKRMISADILNLGELAKVVARGGRWYRAMPGIGKTKAARIEQHLWTLLDRSRVPQDRVIALPAPRLSKKDLIERSTSTELVPRVEDVEVLPARIGMLRANTDAQAVDAWIKAKSGKVATALLYQREGHRLLLWLERERGGLRLADVSPDDCVDYMTFLKYIPERWISKAKAKPGTPGWAPFRGQLSHSSYKQTITVTIQLFNWLVEMQYLKGNPWAGVNTKVGDDPNANMLDSKAFSKGALKEILRVIDAMPPSPSRYRIQFIMKFVTLTGIRAAELVGAKLSSIRMTDDGDWTLQVFGKGSKNRLVTLIGPAYEVLQEYLFRRGLGDLQTAPPDAPLLARTGDPMATVSYQALYETVQIWLKRAIRESNLSAAERAKFSRASTHWLRHTFGTWALEADVAGEVVQVNLGHASFETTIKVYAKPGLNRRAKELAKLANVFS